MAAGDTADGNMSRLKNVRDLLNEGEGALSRTMAALIEERAAYSLGKVARPRKTSKRRRDLCDSDGAIRTRSGRVSKVPFEATGNLSGDDLFR